MQQWKNWNKETLNNKWNNVAPSTEAQEKGDIDEGKKEIVEYPSYDTPNISLLENVSTESQEIGTTFLKDSEYFSLVQSLNKEQYIFFQHILSLMKNEDKPIYAFLTGGVGVRKTVLVKSLFQV